MEVVGAGTCLESLPFAGSAGCASLTIAGLTVAQAGLGSQHAEPSRAGLFPTVLSWLHS